MCVLGASLFIDSSLNALNVGIEKTGGVFGRLVLSVVDIVTELLCLSRIPSQLSSKNNGYYALEEVDYDENE